MLLDTQRVGGGVAGDFECIQRAVADGAQHGTARRLGEKVNQRAFAVGAGNADDGHGARGMVVVVGGDVAEVRAEIGARQGARWWRRIRRFVNDGGGGVAVVVVEGVMTDAARGKPQSVGIKLAVIGGDGADHSFGGGVKGEVRSEEATE